MKKIISIILMLTLILTVMPLSVFAYDDVDPFDISNYTDSELDLSQYTMEDLANMTSDEYFKLLADFERVYDPYDTYKERLENAENGTSTILDEYGVAPLWTSGDPDDDDYEEGTHEYVTARACTILYSDKGFFSDKSAGNIAIALAISLASALPDKDEVGFPIFKGHFYDPETGENYAGGNDNTAKTNARDHYLAAVSAAESGDMNLAYEELGRCLHYVQDANVPHHAANVISYGSLSPHSQFEKYAEENMESFLASYKTVPDAKYTAAEENTVAAMTRKAAKLSKAKIDTVNSTSDKSQWDSTAKYCLKNSVRYSAMVMYRFSRVSAVEFYANK